MKNFLLAAMIGLTLLSSPALAQSRPLRLTLGGGQLTGNGTFHLGLSLDAKRLPLNRVLSVYADSNFTLGFGCGAVFIPNAPPSTTYSGMESFGVSVRQPWGKGWSGVGMGSYTTHFSDCGTADRKVGGLGGKVFAGIGGGFYFTEVALTLPSATKYLQTSISVGFRL